MSKTLLARDIMVRRLVTLRPEMDVFEAVALLLKHRISGAPVVDREGNLLGVFSEKCCMSVILDAAYDQLPRNQVSAFMNCEPPTVHEETSLLSIAQIFLTTPARRLPVVCEGKLVGQVSRRDVIRAAMELIAIAPNEKVKLLYLSALRDVSEVALPR